jgi:hypothetical protein
MSIDGEVLQFAYRKPHALLQIMVPDANRQMQRWTVEWEAPITGFARDDRRSEGRMEVDR